MTHPASPSPDAETHGQATGQVPVSVPADVTALDFAALLCSRVCHDVISPVGAIVNGIEVLEDEGAADMREMALELIINSARQASNRLQFTRLAFGAAGSAGARLDLGDAEQVVRGMIEDDRIKVEWRLPRELLPKNRVKLLLNLMLLATNTIPRGGIIQVEAAGSGDGMGFTIASTGSHSRVPEGVEALVEGAAPAGGLDAHSVQPFYAGMLARDCHVAVRFEKAGDTVTLFAR